MGILIPDNVNKNEDDAPLGERQVLICEEIYSGWSLYR